jgi:hypothetical protein
LAPRLLPVRRPRPLDFRSIGSSKHFLALVDTSKGILRASREMPGQNSGLWVWGGAGKLNRCPSKFCFLYDKGVVARWFSLFSVCFCVSLQLIIKDWASRKPPKLHFCLPNLQFCLTKLTVSCVLTIYHKGLGLQEATQITQISIFVHWNRWEFEGGTTSWCSNLLYIILLLLSPRP